MAEKRGGRTVKKDGIKDAYRGWFNRLDENVPEEVWEGIEDELDIDEVWSNVRTELDRTPVISLRRWFPRAAAVLLLLISALAAYWYLVPAPAGPGKQLAGDAVPGPSTADDPALSDSESSPSGEPGQPPIISQGDKIAGQQQTVGKRLPPSDRQVTEGRSLAAGQQQLAGGRQPAAERRSAEELQVAYDNPNMDLAALLQPVNAQLKPRPSGTPTYSAQLYGKDQVASSSSGENMPFIRLQRLGVVSAYNNTWMLNHETFSGLQPSTLNATAFTYGSSLAINAGFLVGGKHRIGAEMYLSSSSGQKYRQYIEARYQHRSIQLDYYKAQLYYELPVFSGKGDILAGAYASWLKSGREEISGEVHTVGRLYRKMDYGLMAGFQFNLPVNNRLMLQPGIRVNYGLPNIFKGDRHIPENFLRTHNAAAGLYLGISYRFPTF